MPSVQQKVYYAIPRQVQEYAIEHYQKTRDTVSFPEALVRLYQRGELTTEPPAYPPFLPDMTADDFDRMVLSIPFDASNIVEHDRIVPGEGTIDEAGMFPWRRNVFCFKHMPYMSHDLHCHDYFEITYIYRGSCTLLFDGESIRLSEGEMCIIPPMSPHNQPLTPESIAISIVVRKSTFDAIFGELLTEQDLVSSFFRNSLYGAGQSNYLMLRTELLPQFRDVLHQLAHECGLDAPYVNACSASLLKLFLARVLRGYSNTITIYRPDDMTMRRNDFTLILQYIQQNFRTVTLASLAKTFHYSETYLCRLIQRNLNQSFTDTLRGIKIARAKDYLDNTPLKVAEVAELVGYDSVDHFSRIFKKTFGVSPRDYRKTTHQGAGTGDENGISG